MLPLLCKEQGDINGYRS